MPEAGSWYGRALRVGLDARILDKAQRRGPRAWQEVVGSIEHLEREERWVTSNAHVRSGPVAPGSKGQAVTEELWRDQENRRIEALRNRGGKTPAA